MQQTLHDMMTTCLHYFFGLVEGGVESGDIVLPHPFA